jgi:hypothetical protein
MAEPWLKIEHTTPDKPEVQRVARQLGIERDAAFGKFFRMWCWFDKETFDGVAPGIGLEEIDDTVRAKGFAAAALEVGWLKVDEAGSLVMPKFAEFCGEGAKRRALTAWRVAKSAQKTNGDSVSELTPPPLLRKEIGDRREENSNRDRTDRGKPADQSPLEDSVSGGGERLPPLDLSAVDWECVIRSSEALGKRVPPFTDKDRRQWFKFAVMAQVIFSEHWLLDSAEAVVNAKSRSTKNRQAHLVAVLKSKAAEQHVDASTFRGILRRIEIPADVWKSEILKVKK